MLTHLPISSVSLPVNIPPNCLFFTLSIGKLINIHGFAGQHYVEGPQIFLCGLDVSFKRQLFIKLFLPKPSMVSDTKLALKNERINDFPNIGYWHLEVPLSFTLEMWQNKTNIFFSPLLPTQPAYSSNICISPISTILSSN